MIISEQEHLALLGLHLSQIDQLHHLVLLLLVFSLDKNALEIVFSPCGSSNSDIALFLKVFQVFDHFCSKRLEFHGDCFSLFCLELEDRAC